MKSRARPALAGAWRVDAERSIAAAGPDCIDVGSVPKRQMINRRFLRALALVKPSANAAAADPDGISAEAQAITSGDGRAKLSPTITARVAENAGDAPNCLALARRGIGNGRAARPDIWLSG